MTKQPRHAPPRGAREQRPREHEHRQRKPRDASALVLPESLEARLDAGHPWIYRDHVPPAFRAKAGDFVHVECGRFDGWALWDQDSPIALRVFSRHQRPDASWVKARVDEAWALRQRLLPPKTDAFRLLFGEGDGLPGVVVDVYAGFAVIVSYSSALGQIVAHVAQALAERPEIQGVCERVTRRKERASELRRLSGDEPPEVVMIEEHGLRYEVDFEAGQKTGLFLDHRDNRHYLRSLSAGKNVLNLFAYTGAFSISCAAGGASKVTSVDIAAPAIEAAARNVLHNALPASVHEGVAEDVFEFLQGAALGHGDRRSAELRQLALRALRRSAGVQKTARSVALGAHARRAVRRRQLHGAGIARRVPANAGRRRRARGPAPYRRP